MKTLIQLLVLTAGIFPLNAQDLDTGRFNLRLYGAYEVPPNNSANTGLGINLGTDGVTPNDSGDSDTGPNNLQNFPVIQVAAFDTQTISGTLDSSVNGPFTIELFNNGPGACDGSGNGESGAASSRASGARVKVGRALVSFASTLDEKRGA